MLRLTLNHSYRIALIAFAILTAGSVAVIVGVTELSNYGALVQAVDSYYSNGGQPHTPEIAGIVAQMRSLTWTSLPLIGIGLLLIIAGIEVVARRQRDLHSQRIQSKEVEYA